MAITTNRAPLKSQERGPRLVLFSAFSIAAVLFPATGNAVEWRIVPTLDLRETYSDNIRLAPRGAESSDFATTISPGVSIVNDGPNLKLRANYAYEYISYKNDPTGNSSYHRLDATAKADLIKELLSVDGMAGISQQDISLLGSRPVSNVEIDPNRVSVRTAMISPYLHHNFGGIVSGEARYTRTQVSTSSNAPLSSTLDDARLSLNSGPAFRTLGWGLHYDKQRTQQSSFNTVDSTTMGGDLRLMITPQFFLTSTVGYDKFDYVAGADAPSPSGKYYTGGFAWNPTERTNLAASIGKRFYGTTYSLNANTRSRHTVWHVGYDESVTSTPQQFALTSTSSTSDLLNQMFLSEIPDAALRQQAVDRFILSTGIPTTLSRSLNYVTNQFFVQKALQASLAINGLKNTVLLTATNTLRRPQSADPGAVVVVPGGAFTTGETRQLGASAVWSWKFSGRSNATLTADYSRVKLEAANDEQRLKSLRASFSHQFQPKLSGVLEFRRTEQASDLAINAYRENAVSAFVSLKF
ncbi:MAG: hypothetical protein JWR21_1969 [Herminiimonas sp.]|nr:hypothetical protein [Herminiimonas sp.]